MYAPTSRAEYDLLAPTRPYTDWPMGHATTARRNRDARLSRLVDGHERPRPGIRLVQSPWTGKRYVIRTR